jgi:hypothetical protein
MSHLEATEGRSCIIVCKVPAVCNWVSSDTLTNVMLKKYFQDCAVPGQHVATERMSAK